VDAFEIRFGLLEISRGECVDTGDPLFHAVLRVGDARLGVQLRLRVLHVRLRLLQLLLRFTLFASALAFSATRSFSVVFIVRLRSFGQGGGAQCAAAVTEFINS